MVGPKSVCRKGRGGGSAGLARLRHEFHRFREEVGCIRSLPSLHRRWPYLARLEIDSEASSEDGTLWDSGELTHGIFTPAIVSSKTEGNNNPVSVHNLQEFSDLGLESACSTHGLKQLRANAQTSSVQFNETSAKCANDWESEKPVAQFKEENRCSVVQFNPLVSHRQAAETGLESNSNSDDREHFEEGNDPVRPISPCLDSAISQDVSETLHNAVALPDSQLELLEEERNCAVELLYGPGENVAESKRSVEEVGNIGPNLTKDLIRAIGACEVDEKLVELQLQQGINGPSYTGGTLRLRSSEFDLRHDKDADQPIVCSSTSWGPTEIIGDPSLHSYDTTFKGFRSAEACYYDEIVDDILSHSGARVAATAYFTANPRHKHDEKSPVAHRHMTCQNEVDIPSPNVFTTASREEAEFGNLQVLSDCILENHICSLFKLTVSPPGSGQASPLLRNNSLEERDVTDNEKDTRTHDTQVNVSSVLVQSMSPEDSNRTLKLVGYVYEEVPPNIAQAPDQLGSTKTSFLPGKKAVESLCREFDNQTVHASVRPVALYVQRQHDLMEAEERAAVNDLTPCPFQSMPSVVTSPEEERNGKLVERQGVGTSSLIALSGLESLTRLGDECKRDSGLAARMATRIRHALETVGERGRVNDKPKKSYSTEVTWVRGRVDKGLCTGYKARSRIGSPKTEKKLGFKTDSGNLKPKNIGGDSLDEGWISSCGTGAAALSGYSVRPEEPETYLQHVIAALDSGNDSDIGEESDLQQYLSCSSDEAPEKQANCMRERHRARSVSPRGNTEGGTDVSCLKLRNAAHDHHCASGRFPQMQSHMAGRTCCPTVVNQELSKQRHFSSGCTGSRKLSGMNRKLAKSLDVDVPRVIRNFCKDEPPIHEADSANPQEIFVKIDGSTVEIEVGEEPPSIIWTPRGETDQSVAVLTPSQEQNTAEDDDQNSPGAATSLSPKRNSTQVLLEPCEYMDPNVSQTNEDLPVIRFRDPILPGKVAKSVRFHSAAKDSGQHKFYGPKKIRESFDRTVESLARKAQGLEGIETNGEAVAGSQHPARLKQGWVQASGFRIPPAMKSRRRLSAPSHEPYVNHESLDTKTVETFRSRNRHGVVVPVAGDTQGEETSRSILKGSGGASESDSEVQQRRQGGRNGSQETGSKTRFESAIASPAEIKVRRPTRRSILKIPRKEASSGSDCTSGVYHGEGCVSYTDERKEILGAAAAGLASELQVLMRSRSPEYVTNQGELRDDASMASEVYGSRQRMRTHRSNKLPGHFQPRQKALSPQEFPGTSNELTGRSQPVYHLSQGLPTSAHRSRLAGQFKSDYEAGCSYLPSEYQKEPLGQSSSFTKEPFGKLRSFTRSRHPQSISQNCIRALAGGEGRERFAYHEAQSQNLNSASMKRAKQIVRDTLGDVFDYERFQQELGELASELKRVERLGRSLVVLKSGAPELLQKQNRKQQTLDPEKNFNPRVKEGSGPSGNKRHRSTISPLRESEKKMFRSDSGKKAFTIELNAGNQIFPYPADLRHAGIRNITRSEVLRLAGSYSFGHNVRSKMHESQVLPTLQNASISKKPPRKLVAEFKTCAEEAGPTKDIEVSPLEKSCITIMEGGESDRPFGDQLAIKRKSLRPPGSMFKVATPVSWFPGNSMSNRGRKKEVLSTAVILEPSGTLETPGKSTLRPKNVNTSVSKMVSDGVSWRPHGERRSLHDAECPELHTHKVSDFSSDLLKWLLTPSGFDLNDQKDTALKPAFLSVGSKAIEPQTSRSKADERTLERQSWCERMKAFLVSCGALLTETNTSKHRTHSKRPPFTTRLSVHIPMEKEEGLVSLGLPKIANGEARVKKLDRRKGRWDNARNKLRFMPDVETSPGIERSWGSLRQSTRLRNGDSGKKLLVKKTKLGRDVVGPKKGHDLFLTMLNKVSTGITKQKQMVKPVSFQNASERKTRAPDALGKYASALTSLKVKERARLATTNRVKEVSKMGSKKLRMVEVKGAQDCALLRRSKGKNPMHTTSPLSVLDIKSEGAKYQNNKNMEGSPQRRDSDRGMQYFIREMTGSKENWLNVSGGFEFLDSAYEDQKGRRKQNLSSTAPKSSDFRSSSDRSSLHSWTVRSAEVGVPEAFAPISLGQQSLQKKNSKASQHNISPVSVMGVQSGSLQQGFLSEKGQDVRPQRSSSPQELHETSPRGGVNTAVNDSSSLLQISRLQPLGLSDLDSDPLDSFLQVFQEYMEKPEARGSMTPGITGRGASSVVDIQVSQKVSCLDSKSQKETSSCDTGTRSSSAEEDKLTESEELELALLELVIKTVLRDDLIKNAKFGSVPQKKETSSLATDKRKQQRLHIDKGVQALVLDLVHDVKQLSPTRQASDSAKSSDWPDYTCLAEKHSRSESCDDDGDWPEYLGLDEQTGNVEGIERDSPVTEDSSGKIPEPETFHDTSTMTEPLHASKTSPVSSLPTYTSENNDRQSIPFPELASLAVPCLPTLQYNGDASYIAERSSTGVQTNDLSVAQPLNSLYLLPLYCLTDGRPLLTPYSTYPHNPVSDVHSHNQPMQIPTSAQSVLSHAKVAAVSEDVQGTSDKHPSRMKELSVSSQDNESRLVLGRKSSSSTSSGGSLSSPRTPSTPMSSPEHEARVASALAHQRRSQKRRVSPYSVDAVDDAGKGENEDRQTEQKVEHQQLVVSTEEPPSLGRNLYGVKGQEEYSVQQHTGSTLDNQLSGELVPRSFGLCPASSPRTRKELGCRPFVYYDDTGSAELADSYDGSGSSDVSVFPRMYGGLNVPFAGLSIEALARLNSATAGVSVTETRAPSPGETQHPALADGLRANPRQHPLGGHLMYRERELTRWSGVAREQGLPFSEGEIEAGGLGSEGECGRMYTGDGVAQKNLLYTAHQHAGEVSEPGEVSRFGGQQIIKTKSRSMEKGSLIQSLSEGEIRADMIKRAEPGEMNTASSSVEERSSSE